MPEIEIVRPGESLGLSPESAGFAHGYGLFETICLREGRLEFWMAHWRRLAESARALRMDFSFEADEALKAIRELAKDLPDSAVIKLSLIKEGESSKLFVYSRPAIACPDSIGLSLDVPGSLNENSLFAGHKTHNYLENRLAMEVAHATGCYDALRSNSKGQIAEGAISNLFFLRDGCWHTPSLETAALPGVIRSALLERLQVNQGTYTVHDVLTAEGVYLSNSSIGLRPVDWLHHDGNQLDLPSGQLDDYAQALALLSTETAESAVPL